MRRTVCIIMIISFFLTIFTGIAESNVHPGQSGIHTVMAILFVISAFIHAWINRKAIVRYFTGNSQKAG